jgi:hypothetical protein
MKIKLLLSLTALACLLTACGSLGTSTGAVPPAQLVAQFCPGLQTFNTVIGTTPGVSAKVLTDLATVEPLVNAVCKDGATLDTTSLPQSQALKLRIYG